MSVYSPRLFIVFFASLTKSILKKSNENIKNNTNKHFISSWRPRLAASVPPPFHHMYANISLRHLCCIVFDIQSFIRKLLVLRNIALRPKTCCPASTLFLMSSECLMSLVLMAFQTESNKSHFPLVKEP